MAINPSLSIRRKSENFDEIFWEPLKGASNYRLFLETYLKKRDLNLSDFARLTGFGRGFPSDILKGRRRLSAKSFLAFEKALKVPANGRKLFKFLVALEEHDLFPDLDRNSLEQQIAELRGRPWTQPRREVKETEMVAGIKNIFAVKNVLKVYAALGSPQCGASIADLAKKTGCSLNQILEVLPLMEEAGLISHHQIAPIGPSPTKSSMPSAAINLDNSLPLKESDPTQIRYYPKDLHLFLQTHNQSDLWVNAFKLSAAEASQRVESQLGSNSELFFNSTLCVSKAKLPELKNQLRKTILQFVDDSLTADGDQVMNIVLSFFK